MDDILPPAGGLTPRQMMLAHCITARMNAGEAATAMGVSILTVKGMIRAIYRKLDVHSYDDLASWYRYQR